MVRKSNAVPPLPDVDLSLRPGHCPPDACSRMSATATCAHGKFGPLLQRGPVAFAPLAAIEREVGRQFTPEQIALAVDGRPDRLITIDGGLKWQRKPPPPY